MPKLNCSSTFGNFKWVAEAEVTDEQAMVLANRGLLWILQRSPSSEAEKVMAGYEKRPKNFERKSIEFSDELAKVLVKNLSNEIKVEIDEDNSFKFSPTVTAEFHKIGGTSEPKFVEEKQIADKHVKAGDFAQWMHDTVGFDAVAADLEDEAKAATVYGAIKAYKLTMLKTL